MSKSRDDSSTKPASSSRRRKSSRNRSPNSRSRSPRSKSRRRRRSSRSKSRTHNKDAVKSTPPVKPEATASTSSKRSNKSKRDPSNKSRSKSPTASRARRKQEKTSSKSKVEDKVVEEKLGVDLNQVKILINVPSMVPPPALTDVAASNTKASIPEAAREHTQLSNEYSMSINEANIQLNKLVNNNPTSNNNSRSNGFVKFFF